MTTRWNGSRSVEKYTATEADPALFAELQKHMAAYPNVTVRQLLLPTEERGDHSCLVSYNVLEHIDDHVGALQSMARLVRPEGYIVLVCPAFPFAMSPVDIATGHVRRYTKRTMRKALTAAGLEVVQVRYANSLGPDLLLRVHQPAEEAAVHGRDDVVLRPPGGAGGPAPRAPRR